MQTYLILLAALLTMKSYGQHYAKIDIKAQPAGNFSFTKNWAYPWYIIKDEQTGTFTSNFNEPVKKEDTAHLFFTANCNTNVQGTYHIRYCTAEKIEDTVMLTFSDGMPAYASNFYIKIIHGQCSFTPQLVFPGSQAVTKGYTVKKQQLILNKTNYSYNDLLMGYLNMEFVLQEKKKSQKTYYLRGYFKTLVSKNNSEI